MSYITDPIANLMDEHEVVRKTLHNLNLAINSIKSSDFKVTDEIQKRLRLIDQFFKVDAFIHFAKEEDALFPILENYIPKDGGPIGVMLMEHKDLDYNFKQFHEVVDKIVKIDKSNFNELEYFGDGIVQTLWNHADKEDNILFPMANQVLSSEERIKIAKKMEEIENKFKSQNSNVKVTI
jgi:hemerythrin-like domain-containing protein